MQVEKWNELSEPTLVYYAFKVQRGGVDGGLGTGSVSDIRCKEGAGLGWSGLSAGY